MTLALQNYWKEGLKHVFNLTEATGKVNIEKTGKMAFPS